jgi:hypothetical protein
MILRTAQIRVRLMITHPDGHRQINSKQARRHLQVGYPELSIECPQCHSSAGRTCFMGPGYMGITHRARRAVYEQLRSSSLVSSSIA